MLKMGISAKSALFGPLAADAYKTNALLMEFHPLCAQMGLWTQKCTFGAKDDFFRKNAQKGSKCGILAQNAKICKIAQKVNERLRVRDREHGFPDSGPERIHGRGRQNM